jgi:hypothetical protein
MAAQAFIHLSAGTFRWASVLTGSWAVLYAIICLDPATHSKIETGN